MSDRPWGGNGAGGVRAPTAQGGAGEAPAGYVKGRFLRIAVHLASMGHMTDEDLAGRGPLGAQYMAGDVWVVSAQSEVDLNNLPPLADALAQAADNHSVVVLDASGVTFADSTFLNLLLFTHRATDLRIAAPNLQLQRLLNVTGADQVLKIRDSVEDAST